MADERKNFDDKHLEFENNEGTEFYGEEVKGKDILQDGTYYTDVVQEAKNRKKVVVTVTIILSIALIIGLAILGKKFIIDNPEETPSQPTPTTSTEQVEEPKEYTPEYVAPENPMTELLPETQPVKGKTTAFVENNTIQTSDGDNFTLNNLIITATLNECIVEKPADFCNVAEITSENNDKTYYAYFLKDAVNSKFFENPENFEALETTNGAAAKMTISTLNGESTPVLVMAQNTGSGLMFVSADNTPESITALEEAITSTN